MGDYSPKEELANGLSHGLAALASLVGVGFFIAKISTDSDTAKRVSLGIYSVSLVGLYITSTLYHVVQTVRVKKIFRKLDHAAIYLKIAGTYTPFLILGLREYHGLELAIAVWGMASAGILIKIFYANKFRLLSTGVYLAMGWFAVFFMEPLYKSLPPEAWVYLLAGGLCFTVGVIFYLWKKLPYGHTVWHVFVIGGSAFHFTCIYLYLI